MYQNTYLMHHGVKGMHWGVRRYQNPDGTRTNAGKRHERLMYKINEYRDNRAAAKQAKRDARDAAKQAKQEARAEKRADLKAKLTSPEAKQAYKNIAKGAAITAGILAAGYGAKLASEAYHDNKNYKTAIKLADDIISNDTKFNKLGTAGREAARKELIDSNVKALAESSSSQRALNRKLRRDTVKAYLTPGETGSQRRTDLRANKSTGAYNADSNLLSSTSKEFKKRRKEILDIGREADDPVAFAKRVEKRKRKAEEKENKQKFKEQIESLKREKAITKEQEKIHTIKSDAEIHRKRVEEKLQNDKSKRKNKAQLTDAKAKAKMAKEDRKNLKIMMEQNDAAAKRGRKNMKASRKMMKAQAKYGNQQ